MNGWEFLSAIDTLPIKNKITVYIVSSSIDVADRKRADELGIVREFISKPIIQDFYKNLCEG